MFEDKDQPVNMLSEDECWTLLEHTSHGRLALSVGNEPDIFPINYHAHDRLLVMRTNPGEKLFQLTINAKAAFEADGVSSDEAWSVVVKGRARILESRAEIEAADQLPLRPWIRTLKYTYIEVKPTSISGRFFTLGAEPDRY